MAGWLRKIGAPGRVAAPRVPDGEVVYAIGDIHGRLDLLKGMISFIDQDEVAIRKNPKTIIFLGDYIDRGPDPKGVIDAIIALQRSGRHRVITLMGNHESALLSFLDNDQIGPDWAMHGGSSTLRSYGVIPPSGAGGADTWRSARAAFGEALSVEHLTFLRSLKLWEEVGDYLFVHAGVRPGVPMDRQSTRDLLWIRHDFLVSNRAHRKTIVHGHTSSPEPMEGDGRIGVDTGAYATGVLTAVRLEGEGREFMQVSTPDLSTVEAAASNHRRNSA